MYCGIGSAPFRLLLCEACATVLMSVDPRRAPPQLTSWLRRPDQGVSLADRATHPAAVHFGETRLANRRIGELPPWAPTLTPLEQRITHRTEQLLYGALFIMPLSGLLYVMAGNYGVRLFGLWDLPNPIGPAPLTAEIGLWVHVACAMVLLLPLGTHLGLVLGHHFGMRDRLIDRMLPGRTTRL